jgi:hypothetical protein
MIQVKRDCNILIKFYIIMKLVSLVNKTTIGLKVYDDDVMLRPFLTV